MSTTYGAASSDAPDARAVLLAEMARTRAAVDWLAEQIAQLGPEALVKGTRFVRTTTNDDGTKTTVAEAGTIRHGLLALYIEERHHLRGLCRDALRVETDDDDEGVNLLDELAARRAASRQSDSSGRAVPEL